MAALDGSREEDSQGGGSAIQRVKSSRVSNSSGSSSSRYSGNSRGEGRRRRNIGWLMFGSLKLGWIQEGRYFWKEDNVLHQFGLGPGLMSRVRVFQSCYCKIFRKTDYFTWNFGFWKFSLFILLEFSATFAGKIFLSLGGVGLLALFCRMLFFDFSKKKITIF